MTVAYTYDRAGIKSKVDQTVAIEAGKQRSADGAPLFDMLNIYSRDEDVVEAYIDDAMDQVVQRFADVCTVSGTAYTITTADTVASFGSLISAEISRYLTLYAVYAWLIQRYPNIATAFGEKADASMARLVTLVYQRSMPSRSS